MNALLTYLLPALLPAVSDGLRGLFARFTGGAGERPQNVQEAIALMQAQTDRARALAELDRPSENISQWVANMRAAFRYVAVGGILLATIVGAYVGINQAALVVLLDMSGASMSFIIGERMYLGLKK